MERRGWVQKFTGDLSREPRGGTRYWISLIVGCVCLVVYAVLPTVARSLEMSTIQSVTFSVLGLMLVMQSAAELMPEGRKRLIALLRVGSNVAALIFTVLAIVFLLTVTNVIS